MHFRMADKNMLRLLKKQNKIKYINLNIYQDCKNFSVCVINDKVLILSRSIKYLN